MSLGHISELLCFALAVYSSVAAFIAFVVSFARLLVHAHLHFILFLPSYLLLPPHYSVRPHNPDLCLISVLTPSPTLCLIPGTENITDN